MSESEVRAACAALVEFALSCPRGGDARWDQRLHALGVRPLPPEQRQLHLQHGPPLTKGPVLIELRHAIEATARSEAAELDQESWAAMAVQDALREFLNAAKPAVTTSSIFANAMATTKTYGNVTGGAETIRCPTCGAPRMDGQSDMRCGYCGSAMKATDL